MIAAPEIDLKKGFTWTEKAIKSMYFYNMLDKNLCFFPKNRGVFAKGMFLSEKILFFENKNIPRRQYKDLLGTIIR